MCVCVYVCVCVCVCVCVYCVHSVQYVHVTCIFIPITLQLDVAIGHEMTCQYEQALGMYNDLHLLLEQTIAKHSSDSRYQYPQWLKKMTSSWYQCWDCPNLTHPEKAWKVRVIPTYLIPRYLKCIYSVVILIYYPTFYSEYLGNAHIHFAECVP